MRFHLLVVGLLSFAVVYGASQPGGTEHVALGAQSESLQAWQERYERRGASLVEGRDLARTRKQALQSMGGEPQALLANALSPEVFARLPSEIQAESERPVSTVGDYEVLCATPVPGSGWGTIIQRSVRVDGVQYPVVTYGRRLHSGSKYSIPLQGVILNGIFYLSDRAIQPVDEALLMHPPRIQALQTGIRGVVGRVAGKLYRFASVEDVERAEDAIQAAERGLDPHVVPYEPLLTNPVSAAAVNTWSNGPKKLLVILLDFPDLPGNPVTKAGSDNVPVTKEYAQNLMEREVIPFFNSSSNGLTSYTATITKLYRLPNPAAYYCNSSENVRKDARALIATEYPEAYDRYLYVFSSISHLQGSTFWWAGLGSVSGSDTWYNGYFEPGTIHHELGHNCGVGHANALVSDTDDPLSPGAAELEYGDKHDTMGSGDGLHSAEDFNVAFKEAFGWVSTSQVQPLTNSGIHRIYRFDHAARKPNEVVALTYDRENIQTYISYRGGWKGSNEYSQPSNLASGAYIYRNTSKSYTTTQILDMTPLTASVKDAALLPGATFTDSAAGVGVRVLGVGGTGTDAYVDVEAFLFNPNKLPVLSIGSPVLNQPCTVSARLQAPPSKTQLFINGKLWSESAEAQPTFSWEPTETGSHVVLVKATFSDGTTVANSRVVPVIPSSDWEWLTPRPHGYNGKGLAYALNAWWMIADNGTVASSPDGITWTLRTLPTRADLLSIASDGNQIILASEELDDNGQQASTLWRSTDGLTWGAVSTGMSQNKFVYYLNQRWIVLGQGRRLSHSADGITWSTPIEIGSLNQTLQFLLYRNNRWVVGSSGTAVYASTDLQNWAPIIVPAGMDNCRGLGLVGDTLLGVYSLDGASKPSLLQSTDFKTWTTASAPTTSWVHKALAVRDSFVISTNDKIYVTNDARTWSVASLQDGSINALISRGDDLMAVGARARVYKGTSFTSLATVGDTARPYLTGAVRLANGAHLFSSSQGHNLYSYLAGNLRTSSINASLEGITSFNGAYVAIGSGKAFTSPDGVTWTPRPIAQNPYLLSVTVHRNQLVAVGGSGRIFTSTDGVNWTARSSGTDKQLQAVASDGTTLVAVGYSGTVISSTDGISWTRRQTDIQPTGYLYSVAYQPGIGFCVPYQNRLHISADGTHWGSRILSDWHWNAGVASPHGLILGGYQGLGITKDGVNVARASGPEIQRIFHLDETVYAYTGSGLARLSLQASRLVAAQVVKQPQDVTVMEGNAVSFSGQITGSGPLTYQWTRDTKQVAGATSTVLTLESVTKLDAGTYALSATNAAGTVISQSARLTVTDSTVRIVGQPRSVTLKAGTSGVLSVNATADGALAYQWYLNGQPITGATGSSYSVPAATGTVYGRYTVKVTGPTASVTSTGAIVAPPVAINRVGSTVTLAPGGAFALSVQEPVDFVTYQWLRNGQMLIGSTGPTYLTQAAADGTYSVQATVNGVTVTSDPLQLNVQQPANVGHLVNVSVLTHGGVDEEAITLGFVTNGPKSLLIRAVGPSLSSYGVAGVMTDPQLTLYKDVAILSNEDWGGTSALAHTFSTTGAFPLDPLSKDAALLAPVSGLYSARATGRNRVTGQALVEIYETALHPFNEATPRLINLSCRAVVGSGSRAVTVGFVLGGDTARTVLIRAVGPELSRYGVSGTLSDPVMTLFAAGSPVASNDNWGRTIPTSVFSTTGAFPLSDFQSKDAALLITLPPGLYTAQITSKNASLGVALIEVYEVR